MSRPFAACSSRALTLLLAAAGVTAPASCDDGGPAIRVDAITPSAVPEATPASVTVSGAGFHDALHVSIDSTDPAILDRAWRLTIGDAAATSVRRVDDRTLTAILPPTLAPGRYDVTATSPRGARATLPSGLAVIARERDMSVPDLALADAAGDGAAPPDLNPADAGLDLAASPDATVPPDGAPPPAPDASTCFAQSLPADVTGPNLGINLSRIMIDGGGQTAHVAPGATFSLTAHYKLVDNGCCRDQIIVGIAPDMPEACLFDAVAHPGSNTGVMTVQLTAPTVPGTYTLRFHYGQAQSCDLSWWNLNGAPTAMEDFAAICVP